MSKTKRILIATLSGVLFGFVCFGLASSGPETLPTPVALQIILSRTIMGFAIGISVLNVRYWWLHGLIMGLIFSIPLAVSGLMTETAEYSATTILISTLVLGMIYGVLIELITSVLFKAKMQLPGKTS
ncbi:MAG: hypothetical protein K9I68_08600 [Bacteroidales bacterium]|nr:hypothetical protein [Bacteroidales bacterium]MCF8336818.1 hypothetical protein [Bacteroidales bacterium]